MTKRTCTIDGCDTKRVARGWCDKHYRRWKKHGDPLAVKEIHTAGAAESFQLRTRREGDCLIWTGANTPAGYGIITDHGRSKYVYRWVWEQHNGPIPDAMQVDHYVCFNPACCEITHLRLTTHKQNQENRRGAQTNNLSSGSRGVHWDKSRNKWSVNVKHNRRVHFGGRYERLDDAQAAARALRNELFTHNEVDRTGV